MFKYAMVEIQVLFAFLSCRTLYNQKRLIKLFRLLYLIEDTYSWLSKSTIINIGLNRAITLLKGNN